MIKIYIFFCFVFLLFGCSANEIKGNSKMRLFDSFNSLNLEGMADDYQNFNDLKEGNIDKVISNLKRVLDEDFYLLSFIVLDKGAPVIKIAYDEIKNRKIENHFNFYKPVLLDRLNIKESDCKSMTSEDFKIPLDYADENYGFIKLITDDPINFPKYSRNELVKSKIAEIEFSEVRFILYESLKRDVNLNSGIYDIYGRLLIYQEFSPLKQAISLFPLNFDSCEW